MEWVGVAFVAGSTQNKQDALLTAAIFGLQFVWSIEQMYVTLYLIELGMSKSLLSLVWIAGPLCGLVVQLIVGVYSDFCTSQYGRRRPFMIWGSFATAFGLFLLGWSPGIANFIPVDWATPLSMAVAAVLIIDVAVNTCQACCRALIVDMLNSDRQKVANGWASRMASLGHLTSYFIGSLDLKKLGFSNHLKAVCCLYSVVLIVCVAITATAVKERVLIPSILTESVPSAHTSPALSYRPAAYNESEDHPLETVFVGKHPSMFSILKDRIYRLWSVATNLDRVLRSIFKVQLLAWYGWFTFMFYGATYASEVWKHGTSVKTPTPDEMARAASLAFTVFSISSTFFTMVLPKLEVSIVKIWGVSFIVYAVSMLFTGILQNLTQVLVLFGVVGFSWATTLWIPFAMTAERIHALPNAELPEIERLPLEESLRLESPDITVVGVPAYQIADSHDEKSGIILGIHNSALTLPQFVSAFGSFIVFKLVENDSDRPHDDGGHAIAVTLEVGAITALLAAFYTTKVRS